MDLITDRTEGAVYEYTDLNRVERAVQAISAQFISMGIVLDLSVKTDWGLPGDFSARSWPTESQMRRYLGNVAAIKQLFPNTVRLPSSMEKLTWTGANNIEKVLQIALDRIEGIKKAYRYSGEVFAGEE